MKHVTLEKMIIIGLDENDSEHIKECKECQELYNMVNVKVDDNVIKLIDSKVKENVLLKFREMKELGKFNDIKEETIKQNNALLKYAIGLSFSFILITVVSVIIFLVNPPSRENISFSTPGGTVVKSIEGDKIENIRLEVNDHSLFVYIPDIKVNSKISILPEKNVNEIIVVLGNVKYKFQANQIVFSIKDGEVFVNDKKVSPDKKFQSVVFLKNGDQVEGNLIEIKDDVIILETRYGRKEFKKEDIQKIKYSD